MTRLEIQTLVKTLVSEGGNNYFTDAAYNRFINDGFKNVYLIAPYAEEEKTTAAVVDQRAYTMTGVMKYLYMEHDSRPLEWETAEWFRHHDQEWQTITGLPHYAILGNINQWGHMEGATGDTEQQGFILYPIPQDTLTIRAIVIPSPNELTVDGSEPIYPFWAHRAIAYETAALILEAQGEQRGEILAATYRLARDFWINQVEQRRGDRYAEHKTYSIGGTPDVPRTLFRDTHVSATGRAGSGA